MLQVPQLESSGSFNITKVLNVVALATLSVVTHASIYALNFMILVT